MTIRKLTAKEKFEAYKLALYCFHQRVENIEENREKYEKDELESWGAFDEKNNLMAQILNNHYEFYLDGKAVKTGGIGAVSTYPEYRDSGAIREIFNHLLPQAYKNGEVISALFPFNHKFYRKFGYEVIPFKNEYNFAPSVLKDYQKLNFDKEGYSIHRWTLGESLKAFLEVYTEFAAKHNLSAVRNEEQMKNHLKYEKEYQDRRFSYLFTYKEKAIAYLIFKDEYNPEAAHLKVEEAAWTCRDGFYAILNFLSRFGADYGSITLPLPMGIDFLKIVHSPDAYNIEKKTAQHFMLRVINAKKALELIKKPENCDFTIKIEDDLIKENNICLRVLNDRVEAINTRDTFKGAFDIEVNIRALSQLASGAASLDEAELREDVKINDKREMLSQCFCQRNIFVSESF